MVHWTGYIIMRAVTSTCTPTLGLALGKDCGLLAVDTMAMALPCEAESSESDISRACDEMFTSLSVTVTISGWLEVILWPSANHTGKRQHENIYTQSYSVNMNNWNHCTNKD